MLHPSYTELMEKINKEGETGEEPVINSRYSIVIATSKRAREIIGGDEPLVNGMEGEKPLSIAVKELYDSKIKILPGDEENMEDEYTDMWKTFFEAIAIKQRRNTECQRNLMPLWMRKHVTEFQ